MPPASVGIITTIGCPYCKKAKDALSQASIEYVNAELSGNKEALGKVKEFTGQRTVPQVFIGGEFVGGASELLALMEGGAFADRLASVKGKSPFPKELEGTIQAALAAQEGVGSGKASPLDAQMLQLQTDLEQTLIRTTRTIGKREVTCATGAELVKWLEARQLPVAETMAKALKAHVIAPVMHSDKPLAEDPRFTATDVTFYALLSDAPAPKSGEPLNMHYQWFGPARPAVTVSGDLRGKILGLYDAYLSPDGRAVDYAGMGKDAKFREYVNATAELQRVDLSPLTREERMAFFINIYNAIIVHATVVWGSPDTLIKRLKFFSSCIYCIGGAEYSADDMEHGILRNNAASPASLGALLKLPFLKPPQIPAGDPRLAQVVAPRDPRIHFALVCGAKSCPPIKLYTPENLEEGLQDAAVAFCESEVLVDVPKATVTLSKIFQWYGKDFADKEADRLKIIAGFCDEKKRDAILGLLGNKKVHVKYKEYDWSPNSK